MQNSEFSNNLIDCSIFLGIFESRSVQALSILKSEGKILSLNPKCIPANIAAKTKYGLASAPATLCSILLELLLLILGIRKATDLLFGPHELLTGTN